MPYISTNHNSPAVSLSEALLRSIAPDKGLYLPQTITRLPDAFIRNLADMTLQEICFAVCNTLMGGEVDGAVLKNVIDKAFNFDIPMVAVSNRVSALELFHGPTLAVKDFSARFLAQLSMQLSNRSSRNLKLNVLVATNGNSGGAVADAVADLPDANVYILFPKCERRFIGDNLRFTSPNVKAIEVQGSISDCKEIVRMAMTDDSLRDSMHLVTANSVNVVRLIPQVALFFYGASRLMACGIDPAETAFAIPVGNMTMLTSAVIAKRMGLPTGTLVAACNGNAHFCEYLEKGDSALHKPAIETLARAMDMGAPSNLPRMLELYDGNIAQIKRDITAIAVDDNEITDTISSVYSEHAYILDPHSAVAYRGAESACPDAKHIMVMASAHPAKSQCTVEKAIGTDLRIPEKLAYASRLKRHSVKLPPTYPAFKKFILDNNQK